MAADDDRVEEDLGTGDNGSARRGGKVVDGISPRADDPTTPQAAADRAKASNKRMRDAGFGDHKGADIDGEPTSRTR